MPLHTGWLIYYINHVAILCLEQAVMPFYEYIPFLSDFNMGQQLPGFWFVLQLESEKFSGLGET